MLFKIKYLVAKQHPTTKITPVTVTVTGVIIVAICNMKHDTQLIYSIPWMVKLTWRTVQLWQYLRSNSRSQMHAG